MTRTGIYLAFVRAVRAERGDRCEACKRTASEARERRLHVHHLWPIAASGIQDALATCRANVLLLCGWCHKLQHPGKREVPWDSVAIRRGVALR